MNVIELAAIVTALAAVVGIAVTMTKLGKVAGVVEATLSTQNRSIEKVEKKVDDISTIVTQLAITNTRLDSFSAHIVRLDKQIQDLAHGEGFVFPLGEHFPPKTKLGG